MNTQYAEVLSATIEDSVKPIAAATDRTGSYPRSAIDALAAAGLLGLVSSADVGGGGEGMGAAAHVVEKLAGACGSTAMIVLMHYAAVAAVEAYGPNDVREAIANGDHLSSLAFSEAGSRSHFWAPMSSAARVNGHVQLDARKSWVTSSGYADSYVWSSRPVSGDAGMTLWLVPATTSGLDVQGSFDGLGLRGNASRPIHAAGVRVNPEAILGEDGQGLDIALGVVLPWFLVLSAAFSLGLAEAVTTETAEHLKRTRLDHLNQSLAEQPASRGTLARMRLRTDQLRAFVQATVTAISEGREDAKLRVLEVKAVGSEAANAVTDQAMRLCGGAAFRKEVGIERRFRDSLAARVMAPTTEALYDFVGRVTCGLPLFDEGPAQ